MLVVPVGALWLFVYLYKLANNSHPKPTSIMASSRIAVDFLRKHSRVYLLIFIAISDKAVLLLKNTFA